MGGPFVNHHVTVPMAQTTERGARMACETPGELNGDFRRSH